MPHNLSRDEKLALMSSLNWDYLDTAEDMRDGTVKKLQGNGVFLKYSDITWLCI